jgi:hypothetical protein
MIKKEHYHGVDVHQSSGMALAATIPPGASAERVDRGRCHGVLSYYADRPRK